MPRLIDDMRTNGRLYMPQFVLPDKVALWERRAQELHELLCIPDLPVIHIDNVAEYYFLSEQEYWDLTVDFPNLAPPFSMAWFEHKLPKLIHSKDKGDTRIADLIPHGRVGILLYAADREGVTGEDLPPNMRWLLNFEVFIDYGRGAAAAEGPHGTIHLAVDADGRIIGTPWMASYAAPREKSLIHSIMTWIHPALLAISFLHCKNVRVLDEPVIKPLAKKFHKRTGQWPARAKILEIQPLKEILRREGGSHEVGLVKALHICRGHFRDYREGRGLFGKYHQLVWQPQLLRGGKKGDRAPAREIDVKV